MFADLRTALRGCGGGRIHVCIDVIEFLLKKNPSRTRRVRDII